MSLQITPFQLQCIHQHVTATYPLEGCGVLMGEISSDRRRIIAEVWPAENTWSAAEAASLPFDVDTRSHSRQDRYWIDPTFLLAAQRYCSEINLKIVGIYHSHPDHPAIPSECDRILAWPEYSYLIVSVREGVVQETQSWCLDTQHQFVSESISVHAS
jgi:proteasome lid subunit RPN8/RPN11